MTNFFTLPLFSKACSRSCLCQRGSASVLLPHGIEQGVLLAAPSIFQFHDPKARFLERTTTQEMNKILSDKLNLITKIKNLWTVRILSIVSVPYPQVCQNALVSRVIFLLIPSLYSPFLQLLVQPHLFSVPEIGNY